MRTSAIVAIIIALIIAGGVVQLTRPVGQPSIAVQIHPKNQIAGIAPSLPWPAKAESDVAVEGVGQWSPHGSTSPKPIGSLAKMMTAYLVLKAHPLTANATGPSLTVTSKDVALYQHDASTHQSVMPVAAGEKLSERILLEGLLVPSGNNIATMLAQWVGGSVTHFTAQMNAAAKQLGLTNTHYHGPVGLSSATVSTAADQLKLSEIMMKNPVFKQIAAMPQMKVPATGKIVYNYNNLVGHDGIIGVKTGSTTASGGCVVLAKPVSVGGHTVTVYSSVVGQLGTKTFSQLQASLDDAHALLKAAVPAIGMHTVIQKGQKVATIKSPWQSSIPIVAAGAAQLEGWSGLPYTLNLATHLPKGDNIASGTVVGKLSVKMGSQTVTIPVKTAAALHVPSLKYRLLR